VKIPTKFECMGMTVTVEVGGLKHSNEHGTYDSEKQLIAIDANQTKQNRHATFWHEFVHCALSTLAYEELNKDEEFVERMAQCLYQLEKTRR